MCLWVSYPVRKLISMNKVELFQNAGIHPDVPVRRVLALWPVSGPHGLSDDRWAAVQRAASIYEPKNVNKALWRRWRPFIIACLAASEPTRLQCVRGRMLALWNQIARQWASCWGTRLSGRCSYVTLRRAHPELDWRTSSATCRQCSEASWVILGLASDLLRTVLHVEPLLRRSSPSLPPALAESVLRRCKFEDGSSPRIRRHRHLLVMWHASGTGLAETVQPLSVLPNCGGFASRKWLCEMCLQ